MRARPTYPPGVKVVLRTCLLLVAVACSTDDAPVAPSNLTDPADAGAQDAELVVDLGVPPDAMAVAPDAEPINLGPPDLGPPDYGPITWAPPTGQPPMAFEHGIASGDPLEDRVILWTRVSPGGSPAVVDVRWQVSDRPEFFGVISEGVIQTGPERNYTVKVDADGLSPGQTYYYRFEADGVSSPVGRTKTLPAGPLAQLRFAVASCAHFEVGFFNVYRLIARRRTASDDLDAVIHLGDYFYEYGQGEYGETLTGREPEPTQEVLTLQDYRARHARYKTDLDLQAMHATHPIIAVWDDHEAANDAWRDGAQNHSEGREGTWSARKAAAVQAYYEWMPVRDPATMGGPLFRRFDFGELATLHMLDTRLEARDEQFDLGAVITNPLQGGLDLVEALLDQDRTMLGETQERWLDDGLIGSTTAWQLIGNQVLMGQLYAPVLPDIPDLGAAGQAQIRLIAILAQLAEGALQRFLPGPGLPIATDAWDGYIPARARLFETLARVDDVVVVTGDFHNGWALELARDADLKSGGGYDPSTGAGAVAVEFLTPSVTSPGFEGPLPDASLGVVRSAFLRKNEHIKWANLKDRGFMVLSVTPTHVETQYVFVPNVRVSATARSLGPRFEVRRGETRVRGPF